MRLACNMDDAMIVWVYMENYTRKCVWMEKGCDGGKIMRLLLGRYKK